MIVDDEPQIRMLVKTILEKRDYEVSEAEDGLDCIEKLLDGQRPELILLDVMMPKMDGWEAARKIKENEVLKDIIICMLTAKTTTMDALMSLESAQAEWHLNKPISRDLLIQTIEWLLAGGKG